MSQKIKQDISIGNIECGTYNIRVSELLALAELFQTDFNAFFRNLTLGNELL